MISAVLMLIKIYLFIGFGIGVYAITGCLVGYYIKKEDIWKNILRDKNGKRALKQISNMSIMDKGIGIAIIAVLVVVSCTFIWPIAILDVLRLTQH